MITLGGNHKFYQDRMIYQVKAACDFEICGEEIKEGTLGGWISDKDNVGSTNLWLDESSIFLGHLTMSSTAELLVQNSRICAEAIKLTTLGPMEECNIIIDSTIQVKTFEVGIHTEMKDSSVSGGDLYFDGSLIMTAYTLNAKSWESGDTTLVNNNFTTLEGGVQIRVNNFKGAKLFFEDVWIDADEAEITGDVEFDNIQIEAKNLVIGENAAIHALNFYGGVLELKGHISIINSLIEAKKLSLSDYAEIKDSQLLVEELTMCDFSKLVNRNILEKKNIHLTGVSLYPAAK